MKKAQRIRNSLLLKKHKKKCMKGLFTLKVTPRVQLQKQLVMPSVNLEKSKELCWITKRL